MKDLIKVEFIDSQEVFEYACKMLGHNPADLIPDMAKMPEWLRIKSEVGIKLDVIADAIRAGREFKTNQLRWQPIFTAESSTSGFAFSNSAYWSTSTRTPGHAANFSARRNRTFSAKY